ncbi:Rheb-like protein RHB1 [Listeria monocytogenes]|nr:Rheb-like protein RHB1 [Listeria monocytogenes]
MMVTAIQKEQTEKNAAFLTSRPEVDYLERESFFITLKDLNILPHFLGLERNRYVNGRSYF